MSQQTPKNRVLFVRRFAPVLLVFFGVFSLLLLNLRSPKLAQAATNNTINFQARLEMANGSIAPDGYYNVEFKLYSASSGGSALWTEDYLYNGGSPDQRVRVVNGYLSVNLGSITAFPNTINWNQQLWVTMNIGGSGTSTSWDGEMNPRLQLTAVPYAFQAQSAQQLQTLQGSYTGTLQFGTLSANQTITLPNATGTVCLDASVNNCSYLTGSAASGSYIQLQSSSPGTQQTGDFNISGTGIAGALQAPSFDTASAGTLTVGGANATTVNIATNAIAHTIAIGTGAAVQGITVGSTNSTSSVLIQAGTGNLQLQTQGGTLGIGNNAVAQTVTIGNTTGNTAVTLQGGTGNINLVTNNASAGVVVNTQTASTTAFSVQNATGSVFNVDTSGDAVTVGINTTIGGAFVNNGSTLNAASALSNFATGGAIGTAAATVDTHTSFTVNQTTGGQTLTLPSPTNIAAGRIIYIANIGTASFTIGSTIVGSGTNATFLWNGSTWSATAVSTGVTIVGTFSGSSQPNGASISGNTITFGPADATNPGMVSTGTQTLAGAKTFSSAATFSSTINTNTFTGNSLTFGDNSNPATITSGTNRNLNLVASGTGYVVLGASSGTVNINTGVSTGTNNINVGVNTGTDNINIGTNTSSTATVAIGSSSTTTSVTLQGGSSSLSVSNSGVGVGTSTPGGLFVIQGTSTTAFAVQSASSTMFSVNTSTGAITLGTATNGIVFLPSGGTTAYGTAQHTKTILLTPEYAGAVLDAQSDSSCVSNYNGTMTSAYDSTHRTNYYNWTSSSSSFQCYDVVVQVPIPSDFSSWSGTPDIEMEATGFSGNAQYGIAIIDSTGTADANFNNYSVNGTIPGAWYNIANSYSLSGTYTAGNYMTIKIRMQAKSGGSAYLGNIKLTYKSNF